MAGGARSLCQQATRRALWGGSWYTRPGRVRTGGLALPSVGHCVRTPPRDPGRTPPETPVSALPRRSAFPEVLGLPDRNSGWVLAVAERGLTHPKVSPRVDGGAGGGNEGPRSPLSSEGTSAGAILSLTVTGRAGPRLPRCQPAQTRSLGTATPSQPPCHQHVAVASRVTPQTCPLP